MSVWVCVCARGQRATSASWVLGCQDRHQVLLSAVPSCWPTFLSLQVNGLSRVGPHHRQGLSLFMNRQRGTRVYLLKSEDLTAGIYCNSFWPSQSTLTERSVARPSTPRWGGRLWSFSDRTTARLSGERALTCSRGLLVSEADSEGQGLQQALCGCNGNTTAPYTL